jgi:hypothetical protein
LILAKKNQVFRGIQNGLLPTLAAGKSTGFNWANVILRY